MAASFETLPIELRLMIYSHLLCGRHFRPETDANSVTLAPHEAHPITSMLQVSKKYRSEVIDAINANATFLMPQVRSVQAFRKLPFGRFIRSLDIRLTHTNIKPATMEKALEKMQSLRVVTISGIILLGYRILAPKMRDALRICQDFPAPTIPANLWPDVRQSVWLALIGGVPNPWPEHVLNGNSGLMKRGVKVFVEAHYYIVTKKIVATPTPSLIERVLRILSIHPTPGATTKDESTWIIGKMDLKDWIMHFDLEGEKFAVQQIWQDTGV